ncbi:hypothetical protein BDZ91DRAFT_494278 [Kalaharituber pfeilii]|nr:hypothetical protein BDZ91DRAFT_494278 [Kalaharituber pfeilii]
MLPIRPPRRLHSPLPSSPPGHESLPTHPQHRLRSRPAWADAGTDKLTYAAPPHAGSRLAPHRQHRARAGMSYSSRVSTLLSAGLGTARSMHSEERPHEASLARMGNRSDEQAGTAWIRRPPAAQPNPSPAACILCFPLSGLGPVSHPLPLGTPHRYFVQPLLSCPDCKGQTTELVEGNL